MGNKELIHQDCISCGQCAELCPVNCIDFETSRGGYSRSVKNLDECLLCGECLRDCPAVG